MSDFLNHVMGEVRRNPQLAAFGPALESFEYVERFQQMMHVVEFECAHGAQIDNEFGYFVDIKNERNTNKSRCKIYFTSNFIPGPGGEGQVPVFLARTTNVRPYNEYICDADIVKQIVPIGTEPDTGTLVWESSVTPIDDVHALKETVYAVLPLPVLTSHEWDESLNVYVTSDVNLVTTGGSASVSLVGNIVTHITYKQLKCGWWLKTTDKFPKITARTYQTTIEFYWPGILSTFKTVIYDHKDGQVESFNEPVFKDEAYKGPCRAEVTEDWYLLAPTVVAPSILKPLPISMSTPFADLNIGPTLHPAMFFDVTIQSDNPRYESITHHYTWPATSPQEWPVNLWISDVVEPSRGGYLRTRINVFSPPMSGGPPVIPP